MKIRTHRSDVIIPRHELVTMLVSALIPSQYLAPTSVALPPPRRPLRPDVRAVIGQWDLVIEVGRTNADFPDMIKKDSTYRSVGCRPVWLLENMRGNYRRIENSILDVYYFYWRGDNRVDV